MDMRKQDFFFSTTGQKMEKISTTTSTSFPTPFPCIKILRSSLENLKAFSKSGVMSNKMNKQWENVSCREKKLLRLTKEICKLDLQILEFYQAMLKKNLRKLGKKVSRFTNNVDVTTKEAGGTTTPWNQHPGHFGPLTTIGKGREWQTFQYKAGEGENAKRQFSMYYVCIISKKC